MAEVETPTVETPEPTVTKTSEKKLPEPSEVTEKHVKSFGSAEAAIFGLHNENYKFRENIRELKAKLPPDGSVVLTGDEAKAWETYRSLGKPDEIRKIKSEHGELSTFKTTTERNTELANVASVADVKFEVLKQIAGPSLTFETKAVKDPKSGEEVQTVFVKDGDAEPKPFADYMTANWAAFVPALKPEPKKAPNGTPLHGFQTPPPTQPPPQQERRQVRSLVR